MTDVHVVTMADLAPLETMRRCIGANFGEGTWSDTPAPEYRAHVARVQDILNTGDMARRIARTVRPQLRALLGSDNIMIQSNLYLRAARPVAGAQEAVGWHRESMYGCQRQALNVWVPVLGCTPSNSIKYVPGSAAIPDDAMTVTGGGDSAGVEKGSSGHKIGLLYAPKRIVGGVDFSTAIPFDVHSGELAIFHSLLIHGAAINQTDKIRFSVDFRVIAAEHVGAQKVSFAGDGAEYFLRLGE